MFLHDDPDLPAAWAPWFSHEYINYYAMRALPPLCALSPVPVSSNPFTADTAWPLGPRHVDLFRERYTERRRLDPLHSYDYETRNGDFSAEAPTDAAVEPWKILVAYGTEPDLHSDCDLMLDKRQKYTGGSHGWRHMEFRLMGMRIGMARESFRYHRDRARAAFALGNDYWGWRYLSRCTHYLADLGNPFHVKALPAAYFFRHLASTGDLFTTVSAIHKSYELYAERRFREGFPPFGEALAGGAREGSGTGDTAIRSLGRYMRVARKRLDPIFNHFLDSYGRGLIDAFGPLKSDSGEDASILVSVCSANAARVIFSDAHAPLLRRLDAITVEILHDVGRMLGSLLSGFMRRD